MRLNLRRRRSTREKLEALRQAKARVEVLIAQVEARAREAEKVAERRRRAILASALDAILSDPGTDGEALRCILRSRNLTPAQQSALGL